MKIIKWVRGIEHDADGKFHLLHPECWDKCANKPDEERERLWKEMEDAVIDSIRRNRQEASSGVGVRGPCRPSDRARAH